MTGITVILVFNNNKLSSHIDQISEQIITLNKNKNYHDQMFKMIVNLSIKKGKNKEISSTELTCLHNSLIMSTIHTPEKGLSNVCGKYYIIKVRSSSVKSSSTLFSS